MYQLCGPPVHELFAVDVEEKSALAKVDGPEIKLTLVDLQWLQVRTRKDVYYVTKNLK
jgi:hypothetical protein